MANSRDDFSAPVIRTLRERVNNRCSNPDCQKPTSGPHTDPNKVVRVGKAAHICAAALGGKRYDKNMTPAERKDIANGIWLCSNCATLIDTDEQQYPPSLIVEWKRRAEDTARNSLPGQPPPFSPKPETWICGQCFSAVPVGAMVCAACKAEVVLGSTVEERKLDATLGMSLPALTMIVGGAWIPALINKTFNTQISAYFGLQGLPAFFVGIAVSVAIGFFYVNKQDAMRRSTGPRFFRVRHS